MRDPHPFDRDLYDDQDWFSAEDLLVIGDCDDLDRRVDRGEFD